MIPYLVLVSVTAGPVGGAEPAGPLRPAGLGLHLLEPGLHQLRLRLPASGAPPPGARRSGPPSAWPWPPWWAAWCSCSCSGRPSAAWASASAGASTCATPGVRSALKRMAPGLVGTGIHPINVVISTILASQLAVGAQTVLFNSNMMGEMVLGIFAASVATVSLPAMSRLVEAGGPARAAGQPRRRPAGHGGAGDPGRGGHGRAGRPDHRPDLPDRPLRRRGGGLDRPHGGLPGGGPAVHRHRADRRPVPVRPQGLQAARLRRPVRDGGQRGRSPSCSWGPWAPPGSPWPTAWPAWPGLVFLTVALRRRMGALPFREVLGGWAAMALAAGAHGRPGLGRRPGAGPGRVPGPGRHPACGCSPSSPCAPWSTPPCCSPSGCPRRRPSRHGPAPAPPVIRPWAAPPRRRTSLPSPGRRWRAPAAPPGA